MLTKDAKGNYIKWTGRSPKPKRTYGNRFEVLHSSASGWYVFDCRDDRVVKDGLGSEANARKIAEQQSKSAK